jgi:hypothetical protein
MAEKEPAFVVVDRRKFTADGEIRDTYTPAAEEKAAPAATITASQTTTLRIEEALLPEESGPHEAESPSVMTMPHRSTVEAEDFENPPVLGEDFAGTELAHADYDADGEGPGVDEPAHEEESSVEETFVYPEAERRSDHEDSDEPEAPQAPTAAESAAQNEAYQRSAREMDWLLRQANPGMKATAPVGFEHIVQSFYMSAIMAMGAGTEPGQKPRIDILGARQAIDMLSVLADKTRGNLDDKEQRLVDGVAFELRMMFLELTNAIAAQAQQAPGRR